MLRLLQFQQLLRMSIQQPFSDLGLALRLQLQILIFYIFALIGLSSLQLLALSLELLLLDGATHLIQPGALRRMHVFIDGELVCFLRHESGHVRL